MHAFILKCREQTVKAIHNLPQLQKEIPVKCKGIIMNVLPPDFLFTKLANKFPQLSQLP